MRSELITNVVPLSRVNSITGSPPFALVPNRASNETSRLGQRGVRALPALAVPHRTPTSPKHSDKLTLELNQLLEHLLCGGDQPCVGLESS